MIWRLVKLVYLATICFPPPLCIFLYPAIFLWCLPFPSQVLTWYTFYFWIGLVLVLIHLWTLNKKTDTKVLWTVLLVIFGIVTLPIYWFRFVFRENPQV